jgi:hypothetical protein
MRGWPVSPPLVVDVERVDINDVARVGAVAGTARIICDDTERVFRHTAGGYLSFID